jgi:hypothetical protein
MMLSSGFCFHANITDFVTEFAEVVDCHLVNKLGADKSIEMMSERDYAIITGTLDVGVFAEVTGVIFFTPP